MANLGNLKIKDTYQLVLQTDASGNLQNLDGSTPNPFIVNGNLKYLDGSQANGYVLLSDGSGNASWGPVAFSGDVYISGGTITGTTIELNTTSGNTVSIPGLKWSANTDGSISPSGNTTDVIVNGDITTKGSLNLAGTTAYIAKGGTNRLALSTASQSILYGNWKILDSSYFAFDTQSYFRAFRDSNTNRNTLQGTTGGLDLSCSTTNTMNLYSSTIGLGKPSSTVTVNDDLVVSDNTTIGDDLTVNTSTLYVNSTKGKVGVGTLNPDAYLTVSGDSTGFTSYNMNGGSAEFQNNATRVKFSNGANTNDLSPGDRIQVTTNGVTYIVIVSTVDNADNISLTVTFPGQTNDQVEEFNYDDGTNATLFKVYDTTTPVFQVSGSTVMSGSTDLLDIFASSSVTNQDVYWSANTDGSITNSGNTDINTTGNGNFANLQVPAGGYLRFDDVIGSDDQYILGNENNITVDGDQFVKLIANDSIKVGVATNDIKLTIDTSEGSISASGNLGISGNTTVIGGIMSGSTDLLDIFASSAITNQDVYWSANTNGSITNSGNTDIITTGTMVADSISASTSMLSPIISGVTVSASTNVVTPTVSSTTVTLDDYIYHNGDLNTYFGFEFTDTVKQNIGDSNVIRYFPTKTTFNDSGGDVDFQVRTDNDINTLYIVGSSDKVGIGTSGPSEKLTVEGSILASTSMLSPIISGVTLSASTNIDAPIVSATTITGTTSISLPDNGKLKLGNAGDLEIYHNGSNSYIDDTGTGTLFYRSGTQTFQNAAGSKTMAVFNAPNSVDLYYDNNQKFETTNVGIKVTGEAYATTQLLSPIVSGVTVSASTNIEAPTISADTITAGNGEIGNGLISAGTVNGSYQYVGFFSSIAGSYTTTNDWIMSSPGGGISNHTWNQNTNYLGSNNTVGVSKFTPVNGMIHIGMPAPFDGFLEGFFCTCRNNGNATNPRNAGLFVGTPNWGSGTYNDLTLRAYAAGDDDGGSSNSKPYKIDGMLATGYPVSKGDVVVPAMYSPDGDNVSVQCTWTVVFKT